MSTHSQYQTHYFLPLPFAALESGILQRRCACGNHTVAGDKCEDCKNKQGALQRRSSDNSEQTKVPPIVHEVLNSPGQPLDEESRAFFEPRFGDSFSHVRVHTNEKAAESAQSVHALAYTVGKNVVFGRGQYTPKTDAGKHLLAHELSHIVQQNGAASNSETVKLGAANDASEKEADHAAQAVSNGAENYQVQENAAPSVQRMPSKRKRSDSSNDNITGSSTLQEVDTEEDEQVEENAAPDAQAFLFGLLGFLSELRAVLGRGIAGLMRHEPGLPAATENRVREQSAGAEPVRQSSRDKGKEKDTSQGYGHEIMDYDLEDDVDPQRESTSSSKYLAEEARRQGESTSSSTGQALGIEKDEQVSENAATSALSQRHSKRRCTQLTIEQLDSIKSKMAASWSELKSAGEPSSDIQGFNSKGTHSCGARATLNGNTIVEGKFNGATNCHAEMDILQKVINSGATLDKIESIEIELPPCPRCAVVLNKLFPNGKVRIRYLPRKKDSEKDHPWSYPKLAEGNDWAEIMGVPASVADPNQRFNAVNYFNSQKWWEGR